MNHITRTEFAASVMVAGAGPLPANPDPHRLVREAIARAVETLIGISQKVEANKAFFRPAPPYSLAGEAEVANTYSGLLMACGEAFDNLAHEVASIASEQIGDSDRYIEPKTFLSPIRDWLHNEGLDDLTLVAERYDDEYGLVTSVADWQRSFLRVS